MAITPDDKDWTWVLDQPCPECGFDSEAVPREALGDLVAGSVQGWVDPLAEPGAERRPNDHTWSVLEYACHVRDVHLIFETRVRQMLTEDNPTFANWDQDQAALDGAYAAQDPAAVGAQLAEAAETMVHTIDALDADDWQRPGRRSNGSTFTIESLLRYYLHDVVHHEADIA